MGRGRFGAAGREDRAGPRRARGSRDRGRHSGSHLLWCLAASPLAVDLARAVARRPSARAIHAEVAADAEAIGAAIKRQRLPDDGIHRDDGHGLRVAITDLRASERCLCGQRCEAVAALE